MESGGERGVLGWRRCGVVGAGAPTLLHGPPLGVCVVLRVGPSRSLQGLLLIPITPPPLSVPPLPSSPPLPPPGGARPGGGR